MGRLRSLDEAEQIINERGRAPHDEHIVLEDGRILKSPEEVREWVASSTSSPHDGPLA